VEEANLPPHVRRFLSYFPEARRSGDGWLAPCPCPTHGNGDGDRRPSLKIDLRHDGGILVNCRVGCTTADCLAAVGLDLLDLFVRPGDESAPSAVELPANPPLEPDACHRAYSAALGSLSLSDEHREALRRRGAGRRQRPRPERPLQRSHRRHRPSPARGWRFRCLSFRLRSPRSPARSRTPSAAPSITRRSRCSSSPVRPSVRPER
jgi:hypothetical protein